MNAPSERSNVMSKRLMLGYCVLAYVLGWGVQLAIVLAYDNPASAPAHWLMLTMTTPAIATLLLAAFNPSVRSVIKWRPSPQILRFAVPAVLVPTLIGATVVTAAEVMGWGASGWFIFSLEGVEVSGGPWLLGLGSQGWLMFVANVLVTAVLFAAVSAFPAIGEELGWRGFLQGALVERYGITRGVILLGLIWSFFHLPVLLNGYNYPNNPILGSFVLFPLKLVAVSMFMAWLTIHSGSFWLAALAHGAGNSIEYGLVATLGLKVPQIYVDFLHLAATAVIGLIFWRLLLRGEAPAANQASRPRVTPPGQ